VAAAVAAAHPTASPVVGVGAAATVAEAEVEAGGSTRTVARRTTPAAEATEAAAAASTGSRVAGRDTATAVAVVTTQIMITETTMLNFLLGQFQGQRLRMMYVLYLRSMEMLLKLLWSRIGRLVNSKVVVLLNMLLLKRLSEPSELFTTSTLYLG
jgi:hypothetical protein